ncbi:hypothetical protein COV24_00270, partial [candidate division WWE3 bacterium CG10_big_fil_rev_8_21_14_0_10_32_10]
VPIAAQTVTDGSSYTISGVREGIYNFRVVIGYDTIDAWFQAVGGDIYTKTNTVYNQPDNFTILRPDDTHAPTVPALYSFPNNPFVLTDRTTYNLGSGENYILDIQNGVISSNSSITNGGVNSANDLVKILDPSAPNTPLVISCSNCAAKLTDFSEITGVNGYYTSASPPFTVLSNNPPFKLQNLSSASGGVSIFTDASDKIDAVTLNHFNGGADDSGIVVLYATANDLTIDGDILKNTSSPTPNVVIVVDGNLTISSTVHLIEASFVVNGGINISPSSEPLVVKGSLLAKDSIALNRDAQSTTQNKRPVETVIFQPNIYFQEIPQNFKQLMIYISALD